MGRLVIQQIEYVGKQYYYKSPIFGNGINIIEGKNGTGKTTLVDLICYVLGIYVSEFDDKGKETHTEVCNDIDNYVHAKIFIDSKEYTLQRFFKRNVIFVKDQEILTEYPVHRSNGEVFTFSDWMMTKLGIAIVEIYQGTKKNKINFSDLFRLIHYDQSTLPNKIYKNQRNENNFVSDSLFVRKVIFELLMGKAFSDYYSHIGEVIRLEKIKDTKKSIVDNYKDILVQSGIPLEIIDPTELIKKRSSLELQLAKAQIYLGDLKERNYTMGDIQKHLDLLRTSVINMEMKYSDLSIKKLELLRELKNIEQLKEEVILEVTQLKKIIVAHEELNLFSPNTCPYCLKHVVRVENHCICGSQIEEGEYEKFFYSPDEYLDILKSKQKSVDTINDAWDACNEELEGISKDLIYAEIKREKNREEMLGIKSITSVRDIEFNEVNDKILDLREQLQTLNQQILMQQKHDELQKEFVVSKLAYEKAQGKSRNQETAVNLIMDEKLKAFNKIYESLMVNVSKNIRKARIDSDYMPIINDGEYKEASSAVPKRFLYYVTLLRMSLSDRDIMFPKILLIDTPENLGIDHENLQDCILKIIEEQSPEKVEQFQVILTTGPGKYPTSLKQKVLEVLTDDDRLLKRREAVESNLLQK